MKRELRAAIKLCESEGYEVTHKDSANYGCWVDLDPDQEPDGCVLDMGEPTACVFAKRHNRKEQCKYWRRKDDPPK